MQINLDRRAVFLFIILCIGAVYSMRLFQLQVIQHSDYEIKAAENSIKPIEDTPLRGVFYDRNRKLLVQNIPTYTIRVIPAEYDTTKNYLVEAICGLPPGYIHTLLIKNRQFSKFVPIKVKRGVDFSSIGWVEENSTELKGVDYIIEMQRGYLDSIMASHVYGYTKEIPPKLLEADEYYSPGDLIGSNGIERKYEKTLRGIKGYKYVVVDARRREVTNFSKELKNLPSIKGKDLVLGLDALSQKTAEQELRGKTGAVVAIEPQTGEIIAMASSPTYDLNEFSYFTPKEYIQQLYNDKDKPLFNRASSAAHPPGSTFKMLCAIAALQEGVVTENSVFGCSGGFTFGRFFKCHGSHGAINVVHAIEHSCNAYFYQLIFKIGLDRLHDYATRFGLGVKTGVDIMEESRGLIPSEKYYEKIYGKNWPRGIMVSLGIGQGEISATPLQLAGYCALIANNGKSFKPHVVKGYLDENKKYHAIPFEEINTGIRQDVFDIVKNGMFLVVNGGGTGTGIRRSDVQIAGKTGTAQNPHGKDHALFIAFAPYENPKIAVAVLVENAGFGATWAAPIAQKVILAYLMKDPRKPDSKPLAKVVVKPED
ncbi:MAG: penicillin-binding protein 2 [Ignavibacteriales bacterium]|nr:penicillin-binding protein 2 [Ignavibacteriales bacterium]